MLSIGCDFQYKILCSSQEMRLITMALAGKLKRTDDIKDAADLNIRILKGQQYILKERSDLVEGALTIALENLPQKEKTND